MDFMNYLSIGIWGALALIINWWLSKRVRWPRVGRVLVSWLVAAILTFGIIGIFLS